jgi:Holliday junction resolvase-like predicted endonuclease
MPSQIKGELALIGYEGETLAIVEAGSRRARKGQTVLREMGITKEKHEGPLRPVDYFLRERHILPCPLRFDLVAIANTPGQPPVVRLHKAALGPSVPARFE